MGRKHILDAQSVHAMRVMYEQGATQAKIADEFAVSTSTVGSVLRGEYPGPGPIFDLSERNGRKGPRMNVERRKQIEQLLKTTTQAEIARILGVSRQAINGYIRLHGLKGE